MPFPIALPGRAGTVVPPRPGKETETPARSRAVCGIE
jgi:hypothetical protein